MYASTCYFIPYEKLQHVLFAVNTRIHYIASINNYHKGVFMGDGNVHDIRRQWNLQVGRHLTELYI